MIKSQNHSIQKFLPCFRPTFTFSHLADAFIQSDLHLRTKSSHREEAMTTQEVLKIV